MRSIFITGTDTDAGKTYVSVLLLKAMNQAGLQTIGFKPIAAGCDSTSEGLRNEDATNLQSAASTSLPYDLVNPVAFVEPIAPHIAAQKIGINIDMQVVSSTLQQLQSKNADVLLIEGAGGWRLPVSLACAEGEQNRFLSDFVAQQKLPVILVVGMKLGCLNHAALTLEQVKRDNCEVVGWIANQVDPKMACYAENLMSLKSLLDKPFLGEVAYNSENILLEESALAAITER